MVTDGDTFKYCNLIYGMFPNSNFDRTWHAGVLEECTQDSRRFVLPIVIHASSNCVIRDEWPLNTTFQIKANAYCSIIGIRLNMQRPGIVVLTLQLTCKMDGL